MKLLLAILILLSGCSFFKPEPFHIGRGHMVESIKIKPNKGPKSVYRVERYV